MHFFLTTAQRLSRTLSLSPWPWARMMINVLASLLCEPNVEGLSFFLLEEMAFGGSNRMSRCWPWLWTTRPPPLSLHQHPSNMRWLKLIQDPKTSGAFFFFLPLVLAHLETSMKEVGTQCFSYGVSLTTDRLSQVWAVWSFDREFGLMCLCSKKELLLTIRFWCWI